MRIVILTVGHVYANYIVKELIKEFEKDVKLIVESKVLLHNKPLAPSLKRYLKVSGLYYVFAQSIKLGLYKWLSRAFSFLYKKKVNNKFLLYETLARKYGIKITEVFNINDDKSLRIIKKENPDLLVSVFFNQILFPKIINIAKKGVLNVHPAYLPDYKGVSPVFWALSNEEKEIGATVHFINEGIDTGRIIKRKKVKVNNSDTEDSLYWRSMKEGSPLLISAIKEISKGRVKTLPNRGGRYFSLPTKEAVRRFKKNGRGFLRLSEYIFTQ